MEKRPERGRREAGRLWEAHSAGVQLLLAQLRVEDGGCGVCVWRGVSLGPRYVLIVEPIGPC